MEWHLGDYTLSDDPARLDMRAICSLLAGTYWAADRAPAVVERSVRESLSLGLYKDGTQVGFARVVTDRATVAYLCDVIVADAHRGAGLGKWMLACILDHPDLRECRMDLFTRDAQEFYRNFGFGPHRFTSMVRYPPGYAGGSQPGD
jgi:GNAT superfamily N-acetyltransferase